MSIATMEKEIVEATVKSNQAMRAIPKTSSFIALNFQVRVATSKTGSFVGLTWLLTGISEEKIYS